MTSTFAKWLALAVLLFVALAEEIPEDRFFDGTKEEFNTYLKRLHSQIDVSGPGLRAELSRIRRDMEEILEEVKNIDEDSCFEFKLQQKGSTVEGLKIGFPDEFDFALVNPKWTGKIVLVETEKTPPGFGFAVDENKETCLKKYFVKGTNYVDPGEVRKALRNLVEDAMRNLKMFGRIKDQAVTEGGPAVTFEEITPNDRKYPLISIDLAIAIDLTEWPKSARDLPPEIPRANAQLVPKVLSDPNTDVWQISFSKTEAEILKDIDRDGGSRKKVLQLAKHLKSRAIGKGFSLASYHLKMTMISFLKLNSDLNKPEYWTDDKIADRFMDLINRLLRSLKKGSLSSYFVKDCDIFHGKPDLLSAYKSIREAVEKMYENPEAFLPANDNPIPRHKMHRFKKYKKPYYILNI